MSTTRFIETTQFTAQVVALGAEEALRQLQVQLAAAPKTGDLLRATGGFRKVRMALPGRGKSGDARVIYYYLASRERIVFFDLFTKNEAANISKEGANALRKAAADLSAEAASLACKGVGGGRVSQKVNVLCQLNRKRTFPKRRSKSPSTRRTYWPPFTASPRR